MANLNTTLLLLYSKYSVSCQHILRLYRQSSIEKQTAFTLLCIDDPEVRARVRELSIDFVPSVLLYESSKIRPLYKDAQAVLTWLIEELTPPNSMTLIQENDHIANKNISDVAKRLAEEREDSNLSYPSQDVALNLSKEHYVSNRINTEQAFARRNQSLKTNNLPFQERLALESKTRSSVADIASKMAQERERLEPTENG